MTLLRILPFLLLIVGMFYYPQEVLSSATTGLTLWVSYILPALFPFFVISDILMKQGFVHFLGVLLEPLMRPIFRLPGKASFILAMTHTSGIPIGAILTCKMRKDGELTRAEGERLLAFSSNPSPGFMFGAVASGMLANPALGIIIAGSIYISNLIVGLIFRFYGNSPAIPPKQKISLRMAWRELEMAQQKNKKPLGELIAESVRESTSTILLVGGFIVFFSVITQMLTVWNITHILAGLTNILTAGMLSQAGGIALVNGLIETSLGCKAAVTAFSTLNAQVGVLAFILGWGGLSVFAQVASFTASTDLRFLPFLLGRTLHGILALIISQIILKYSEIPTATLPGPLTDGSSIWVVSLRWSFLYFLGIIMVLIIIGFFLRLWKRSS